MVVHKANDYLIEIINARLRGESPGDSTEEVKPPAVPDYSTIAIAGKSLDWVLAPANWTSLSKVNRAALPHENAPPACNPVS